MIDALAMIWLVAGIQICGCAARLSDFRRNTSKACSFASTPMHWTSCIDILYPRTEDLYCLFIGCNSGSGCHAYTAYKSGPLAITQTRGPIPGAVVRKRKTIYRFFGRLLRTRNLSLIFSSFSELLVVYSSSLGPLPVEQHRGQLAITQLCEQHRRPPIK